MLVVYASRGGNVASLVNSLNVRALNIDEAKDLKEDYILFTYTDGLGEVPWEVEEFLNEHSEHLKGVIASGDMMYGEENYCASGDKIAMMYGVPCLYKFENGGTNEDIEAILKLLS